MLWEQLVEQGKKLEYEIIPGFSQWWENRKETIASRERQRYPVRCRGRVSYFSQREAECVIEMSMGYTQKTIAQRLHLSPRTVEYYLNNVRYKTGCANKKELLSLLVRSQALGRLKLAMFIAMAYQED